MGFLTAGTLESNCCYDCVRSRNELESRWTVVQPSNNQKRQVACLGTHYAAGIEACLLDLYVQAAHVKWIFAHMNPMN